MLLLRLPLLAAVEKKKGKSWWAEQYPTNIKEYLAKINEAKHQPASKAPVYEKNTGNFNRVMDPNIPKKITGKFNDIGYAISFGKIVPIQRQKPPEPGHQPISWDNGISNPFEKSELPEVGERDGKGGVWMDKTKPLELEEKFPVLKSPPGWWNDPPWWLHEIPWWLKRCKHKETCILQPGSPPEKRSDIEKKEQFVKPPERLSEKMASVRIPRDHTSNPPFFKDKKGNYVNSVDTQHTLYQRN